MQTIKIGNKVYALTAVATKGKHRHAHRKKHRAKAQRQAPPQQQSGNLFGDWGNPAFGGLAY